MINNNNNKYNKRPYDEDLAQAFLSNEELDNCIIYCLPIIQLYLNKHKWSFINQENLEDIEQELALSLIKAVRTYNSDKLDKPVKLLTHIYNHFKWHLLNYQDRVLKRQIDYYCPHLQLKEDLYNIEVDSNISSNISEL